MQALDLKRVIEGDREAQNFHALLFRCILKADGGNLTLLEKAFPNAVLTVLHYRAKGNIPDLPYDEPQTPPTYQEREALKVQNELK